MPALWRKDVATTAERRMIMARLIDADTLHRKVNMEIVRCRDCKHYEIHKPKVLENCERNGYIIPMKPDDFCSYGERKNEVNE